MDIFNAIFAEYVAIYEHLAKKKGLPVVSGRLLVDRATVETMMNRNQYLPATEKWRVYKQLHLIEAGGKNATRSVYDPESKKTVRKIVFSAATYRTIKALMEEYEGSI